MLLTSLYFSRGDRSPLDTPSVPEKPPGIPPSPLHGRGGSGHRVPSLVCRADERGVSKKVSSGTFFVYRGDEIPPIRRFTASLLP